MTTLNTLRAVLSLLPNSLPGDNRRRALLALNRTAPRIPADADVALDALLTALAQAHAAGPVAARQAADERRALRLLLALPLPDPALLSAVAAGTATLADADRAVALQDWSSKRLADHRAALQRFADVVRHGKALAEIPASEAAIRKALTRVPSATFGVQPRTFANLRSRILAAVKLVDMQGRIRLAAQSVSPAWQAQLDVLPPTWRRKLWPLVTYAMVRGLEPLDVGNDTLAALADELARREDRDPHKRVQHVVYAWERVRKQMPGLPELSRRFSARAASSLGWDRLPAAFRESWTAYVEAELAIPRRSARNDLERDFDYAALYRANPDDLFGHLFGEAVAASGTGLDDSLTRYRAAITYAAFADPEPQALTHFRQVLTRRHLTGALTALIARQCARRQPGDPPVEKRTNYAWSVATVLCLLARDAGAEAVELEEMRRVRLDVDPKIISLTRDPRTGAIKAKYRSGSVMGPRHRRALDAIVHHRTAFRAWAETPNRLWARAETAAKSGRITPAAAYDALIACAHELQRSCPVRIESFVEARLWGNRQNLFLTGDHGLLVLSANELKYGDDDLTIRLTRIATRRLRAFRDTFRPVLCRHVGADRSNPYLVPSGGQGHKLGKSVGEIYVARNRDQGYYLPFHVGRHLAAWLMAEAGIGLDQISRVLDHASPATTAAYYASLGRIRDLQLYQELLARHLELAASPSGKAA